MDKRNSLYRSNRSTNFNTTSIYSPIAESTHIQSKSTLNGKFPWGGQISPIQKSSSSSNNLDRTKPTSSLSSSIKISPINRSSVIDPRIYTDIRSKGLASRIVKYHDDSVKLNRSLSAGNRYNRPGQFPIVHLNKSQIQYKANRNRPASVVRIAPPDKVIFHANTRSSILRSPSVVPTVNLRKTNSELSCENRPILHPAENDLVPTRSVLDALKEISRKRINSDDLDGLDMAKKYCKDISVLRMNASNSSTSINNSYAIKRQREGQSSPNSKAINSEQVIKKRMCVPSNDITSSLSSSIHMLTPKRKLSELNAGGNSTGSNSTSSENSISPKAKQSCNELNNKEKQQLINDKSKLNIPQSSYVAVNQITPLPSTPNMNEIQYHHHTLNSYQIPIENVSENSSTVHNSIPVISIPKEDVNRQHKPKLTLFNKDYDDEEFKRNFNSRKNLREQTDDDDEVNFVKPRNGSAAQFENNPIIEKMKQTRLALMLKGLRGELNDDSNDENDNEDVTDTPQKLANTTENKETTKSIEPEKTTEPVISLAATTTSGASMSFATKTTDSTSIISSAIVVSPRTSLSSNQMQSSSGTSTGFNFGLKTTDSNTSPSIATNQNPSSTAATSTGFSFGLNSTANTQSETITSASTSIATNPTTTVATMGGFAFTAPKVIGTSATTSITNANSVLSTQSPLANTTSSTPQLSQSSFSFRDQQQKSAFSLASSNSAFAPPSGVPKSTEQKPETTSPITAASKFVFGGGQTLSDKQQSTENNQISGNSSNSSAKPIFGMFSSNPQSTFSTSTTQAVTTATSTTSNQISSFSFSNNQVSSNAQEKPTFGGFGLQSNKTFGNFPSSSQPATTTTSAVSTFGSFSQDKSAAASMFGSNTNKTPSFGNPAVSSTEIPKTTNLFENKSSTGAGFSFVELAASQNANNTNKESTTFSTPFAFGSNSKSATVGGFSFKNTATTTAAATSTTTITPSQFSFVGSGNSSGISSFNAPSTSTSEIGTTKPGFSFGGQQKGSDATKTFSFNAPSTTSTTSASGFSFGGTSSTENKQSNFSFGAATTAAATTTNAALSASSFSFTKPATTSQNTFGNLNATKTFAGGFAFDKPTTFGTFSSNPAATAGQSQTELSSTNKFSFSNVAANSNIENKTTETPAASSSSIFSGNSQNPTFGNPPSLGQSKTFNFASTNNTASNTSQNIFGGSTPLPSGTNLFGSSGISSLGSKPASSSTFSFGSSTTNQQGTSSNTPFAFGSSSTAATPASATATTGGSLLTGGILSSSSSSTSDNSKPFTFGSSLTASNEQQQQQQQKSDTTKLFSFGASSSSSSLSASNTNTNLFAATLNNPPSFNFSAQVNNNGNAFGGAVGTVTDRPIRKATRRLTNKTS